MKEFLEWWDNTHDFKYIQGSGQYESLAHKCWKAGYDWPKVPKPLEWKWLSYSGLWRAISPLGTYMVRGTKWCPPLGEYIQTESEDAAKAACFGHYTDKCRGLFQ